MSLSFLPLPSHLLKLIPLFYPHLGLVCFSLFLLLLLLLVWILNDPLLPKASQRKEMMLVLIWAICLQCEMLSLSWSFVTASPGIKILKQILALTAGRGDDNQTDLFPFFSLFLCLFFTCSSDHTDRPHCSQNQDAGFPGFSGLSRVSNGCLLCW